MNDKVTITTDADQALRQGPLKVDSKYPPIKTKAELLQALESDTMKYPGHRHELRERLRCTDTSVWVDSRG